MDLFKVTWKLLSQIEPVFSRKTTFFWAVMVIISFCVRQDFFGGVSSFVRSSFIDPIHYPGLLGFFHSNAIDLQALARLWTNAVIRALQSFTPTFNDALIFALDGIKISKEGVKMPGVKSLYQESSNNSKSTYIMGHSFQCISLIAGVCNSFFAIPLIAQICEGTKLSNRDKRTLYDKAVSMLITILNEKQKFYLVADAYYSVRKMYSKVMAEGGHVISKAKLTAIGYGIPASKKKGRGRKKKYGAKVKLKNLFNDLSTFIEIESCVYGEKGVKVLTLTKDLLVKGHGMLRFVLYSHPIRGNMILVSTDLTLSASDILRIYGLSKVNVLSDVKSRKFTSLSRGEFLIFSAFGNIYME